MADSLLSAMLESSYRPAERDPGSPGASGGSSGNSGLSRALITNRGTGRIRVCRLVIYDRLVILRCTKKLLAVLGVGQVGVDAPAVDTDWYANLLWCEGRKCLLLTHAATLFTAVQADVRAAELRSTRRLVLGLIGRELASEGLPPDTFGDLAAQDLQVTTTADRSVVGCMTDMAHYWMAGVMSHGGLAKADLAALNRSLRRNINSARGYQRPIELTVKYLNA